MEPPAAVKLSDSMARTKGTLQIKAGLGGDSVAIENPTLAQTSSQKLPSTSSNTCVNAGSAWCNYGTYISNMPAATRDSEAHAICPDHHLEIKTLRRIMMLNITSSSWRNSQSTRRIRASRAFELSGKGLSWFVLCGALFTVPLAVLGSSGAQLMDGAETGSAVLSAAAQEKMAKGPGSEERCTDNEQCPKDSYCAKPIGQCKGSGECEDRPEICTQEYDPVCGCDGDTYSNVCVAASAGVNVDYLGECGEPGIVTE